MNINFTVPSDIIDAVNYFEPYKGDNPSEYTNGEWTKEIFRRKIKAYILRYRQKVASDSAIENIVVEDNEVQ